MKFSRLAAATAACALALPADAGACIVASPVPRITAADLAAVSDVAIVDVTEVAQNNLECRVKAVVRAVERGNLYAAGQRIDFRLHCAGEGATLRFPNSPWLYSDLPVAGQPGLLHHDIRFTPPGPHFLNIRQVPTPEVPASASASEIKL